MPTYSQSMSLHERALRVIPGGAQTLSKRADPGLAGIHPIFFTHGEGCRLYDVDGNEFIDYTMGLGPIILGYNYPRVMEAARRQLERGTVVSGPHPLEIEVAEQICDMVPCAEMVRFGKNGVDATSAIVRIARVVTGREVVVHCGYHGWHDWAMAEREEKGIPACMRDLLYSFEYNNLESVEAVLDKLSGRVALVLMEPVYAELPAPGFLQAVRDLTHEHGAVFAFDEIVTGFRLAPGGAQEYLGVVPDMCALGKAMSNGFPLSAFCGKRELMEAATPMTSSMTYSGELVSLAAARACMSEIREQPVIEHIFRMGERLQEGLGEAIQRHGIAGHVAGLPVMCKPDLDEEDDDLLHDAWRFVQQETARRGVFHRRGRGMCICYSHREPDIAQTISAFDESLALLREALDAGDLRSRIETDADGRATYIPPVRDMPGRVAVEPPSQQSWRRTR